MKRKSIKSQRIPEQTEPIIFDGIEYQWKELGGHFRLYPKSLTAWPTLDVSSYQPKKKKPTEQASLFPAKYGD